MPETPPPPHPSHPKLSWKDGLFLVAPDPLTSLFYSSGALIVAGMGYATPAFQIGLYLLLFMLAPLYIEAVLLTLSNGGTYVMTRYALNRLGRWATVVAAAVGVVISFSYVATAIVSLLSYSYYTMSLFHGFSGHVVLSVIASAVPSVGFGVWVMPTQWRSTLLSVTLTSAAAISLSTIIPPHVAVMLAPLVMLFRLNNFGLKESVKVSKTIFLANMVVMALTITLGVIYVLVHGANMDHFLHGAALPEVTPDAGERPPWLPGFFTLGAALIPAALGSSILGASGVESVMNIPEELAHPRSAVRKIYKWMLSILAIVGSSTAILLFLVLTPEQLVGESGFLLATLGQTIVGGLTGVPWMGTVFKLIIVIDAALMLLAATNTGFAGARGLWVTMARDSLLPRYLLKTNERGAYERVHWLMLIAIFFVCARAGADMEILERWYGATFGLVMFSGVVAFILLRKYKATDRRTYLATPNVEVAGIQMPVAAIIGLPLLALALLGLYAKYQEQIGALEDLLFTMSIGVGLVLLAYNHRPLLRYAHSYYVRVVETVEEAELETTEDTVVVAVGGARIGSLIRSAMHKAGRIGLKEGKEYHRLVVFHMTPSVSAEHAYKVAPDSLRPTGLPTDAVRIFTELTQLVTIDAVTFLVLAPSPPGGPQKLHDVAEALVKFHDAHDLSGHLIIYGDDGFSEADKTELAEMLSDATVLAVPV